MINKSCLIDFSPLPPLSWLLFSESQRGGGGAGDGWRGLEERRHGGRNRWKEGGEEGLRGDKYSVEMNPEKDGRKEV